MAGATLSGNPDGPTQLQLALTNDAPDAAVFAFGTYDIPFMIAIANYFGVAPGIEPIVTAYRSIVADAEASDLTTFVALTPTLGTYATGQHNELVRKLNNRLRHEFRSERVLDFFSPMIPGQDWTPPEQTLVNQSGQNKRGAVARHELDN